MVFQALTMNLPGDSPRNLHWGIFVSEQPGFLINTVDPYERIKGFPPDPPTLASRQLYNNPPSSLHRWWGPVVPLMLAGVWSLTESYFLLRLILPLAGAGAVVVVYILARHIMNPREALIATIFFAFFPLFRHFASTGYTEAFATFVLTAAFLSYLRQKTLLTMAFGTIAILTKLDLIFLYCSVIGCCIIFSLIRRNREYRLSHHILSFVVPITLSSPWVWFHHLQAGDAGPIHNFSMEVFLTLVPQLIELLFFIPLYGSLITLAAITWCVIIAIQTKLISQFQLVLLGSWLLCGIFVLLVYAATPGAGNSPRIIIPALPPLAILFAVGFTRLGVAWRRRIGFYLIVLFTVINLFTIGYYTIEGNKLRSLQPVWYVLREQPRGFVLTEQYWATVLFSRQPVTWFESDKVFEESIMHNRGNFAQYVEQHPIRYVILPQQQDVLASTKVYEYLEQNAESIYIGKHILYRFY